MIKLTDVTKDYDGKQVLKGISLCVKPNETLGIMGESGCGKTTLLNIMAGLTDCQGQVEKSGGTSYIFQQPRLVKNLTVRENLYFVGAGEPEVKEILAEVGVEGGLYPEELSGGMAGRVALARAFVYGGTLLMDEPFAGLDIKRKNQMMRLFTSLKAQKPRAAVLVTHSLDEAVELCDRILLIDEGVVSNEFQAPFDANFIRQKLL